MSGPGLFSFNHDAEVKLTHIGRRQSTVTRIDNVLHDPERIAALGFAQTYVEDRSNLYPGMRAATPPSFSTAFRTGLQPLLRRHGVVASHQALCRDSSFFSVVTTASQDLLPIQRIPHYDSTDPGLLAAVIYLCAAPFSGTSFYRHRRTGTEEITAANRLNYQLALDHDMRVHGPPRREYMNGDSLLFEVIHSNELRFNSAIVYSSRILHAADIDRQFVPPRDHSEWRLTITSLVEVA